MERRELLTSIGLFSAISAIPLSSAMAKQMEEDPHLASLCLKATNLGFDLGSDENLRSQYEPAVISICDAISSQTVSDSHWRSLAKQVPGLAAIANSWSNVQGDGGGRGTPPSIVVVVLLIAWGIGFAAGWIARGWFKKHDALSDHM